MQGLAKCFCFFLHSTFSKYVYSGSILWIGSIEDGFRDSIAAILRRRCPCYYYHSYKRCHKLCSGHVQELFVVHEESTVGHCGDEWIFTLPCPHNQDTLL